MTESNLTENLLLAPTVTFDSILKERVGYGYVQTLGLIVAATVAFADGCEMIIIPFLNLVLEKEEGLNKSGQSLMSCIVFIGMASGSMCSGFWGDLIGRKRAIQLFAGFIFAFGFACGLSWNLTILFFFRGMFGFGIGNILPGN